MTNKSKEEKRMILLDMQEHPDCYTDEQIESLLADAEMKDLFHEMALVKMALKKANPKRVNVDEAWNEFASKQGPVSDGVSQSSSNRFKIAASVIGVIFLSGITFAAIHSGIFSSSSSEDTHQVKTEQVIPAPKTVRHADVSEKTDSLDLKPVVFDNAELGDVVSQLAAFYQVKVEFEKTESRHIRIFFNWDKAKTLNQNLEILNAFDRIQITEADGILKVE